MTPTLSPSQIISHGALTGHYQAFPDACRLHNGDIAVVFYAGSGHVTLPSAEYPRAGRICLTFSSDEGLTWTEPTILYDDEFDNRDPHIAQLADGTLICSFFSLLHGEKLGDWEALGAKLVYSQDGGITWNTDYGQQLELPHYFCSAPVRQLSDGTCLLPLYIQKDDQAWGAVIHSQDAGRTWSGPVAIGQESGLFLPAETDIVEREDGSLLALLRGDTAPLRGGTDINMQSAVSTDCGHTWSAVRDLGFMAHAPHLTRHSSGALLFAHRGMPLPDYDGEDTNLPEFYWQDKYTGLRISYDDGESWSEPHVLSASPGAYPSCVELEDGSVLVVYYAEGEASSVAALRFYLP